MAPQSRLFGGLRQIRSAGKTPGAFSSFSQGASLRNGLPMAPAGQHFVACICPGCGGGGARSPKDRSSAALSAGTTGSSASPTVSLQTMADYLTTKFWLDSGNPTRRFNLTSSGPAAKNGVLTYNLSGWADDPNGIALDRRDLTREVLKVYSAVLGIRFQEVTGAGGDIRFTDNDTGAYAYSSVTYLDAARTSSVINYSVVNVEANWYDGRANYNTYVPHTIFHELGHATGLGHQGPYNYTGTPLTYSNSAIFSNDSWQATMMSYWDQAENPTTGASFAWLQTPMAVDWIGFNDLYASQGYGTFNAFTGDTIYGFGTNISASVSDIWNKFSTYAGVDAHTIVDAGGYDKLDLSGFSATQLINLAPSLPGATQPSVSNVGGKIGNLSIAVGTIIEAAVGGSGVDSFYGNNAANSFWGNGGNDNFFDSLGSDYYYGDAGIDSVFFSDSIDLFGIASSGDALLLSRRVGSSDVDQIWRGVETISFNNVAYTYDQLLAGVTLPSLPVVLISAANGLSSGAITNSVALNFTGSLSQALAQGQRIAFYRNGVEVGTALPTAVGATTWSFAYQETAGNNSNSYTARVVDNTSQGGLSSPFLLTIDTVAPLVSVNPLDTYDTTPVLSGTVSEANAVVSVTLLGVTRTALNDGQGKWSVQWDVPLSTGQTYDVQVSAVDGAGNSGTDASSAELFVRGDDYAANSSTTGQVSIGGSTPGIIEQLGDHDWFAIVLQAGRTYAMGLTGDTLVDPLLRLRSGAGVELAMNDDISSTNRNSRISYTATSTGTYYLDAGAWNEGYTGTYRVEVADVTPQPLYFSLANAITTASSTVLGGLTAQTNDIIAFDGNRFSIWMNGNASGLTGASLRDFEVINSNEVVVAFNAPITLAGIAFDDSDLAKITRGANGTTISMFFDGSDVGLTTAAEAIDAVTGLANGSWVISTRGTGSVVVAGANFSFAPEDLMQFAPTSLGANTAGTWSLYADMSDVGLVTSNKDLSENVVAVDVAASTGRIVMATQGNALATNLNASNEDAFGFLPTSLGANTNGSFISPLLFDGSVYGLTTNALMGLDVPA